MFPNFVFRLYNTMVLGWLLNSITLTQAFSLWANINGTGYDLSIVLCLFEVWKKDKSTTHSTLTMVIFSAFLVHTPPPVFHQLFQAKKDCFTHIRLLQDFHIPLFSILWCVWWGASFLREKRKHSLVKYFREARSTLCHTAVYSSLVHKTSMHGKTHWWK